MSTKQDLERVREALGCGDYSNYSFDELMDQYDALKAIQSFEQTQPTFVTEFPGKKAKEIALQTALTMGPNYDLLNEAEKIYQWLISDSSNPVK